MRRVLRVQFKDHVPTPRPGQSAAFHKWDALASKTWVPTEGTWCETEDEVLYFHADGVEWCVEVPLSAVDYLVTLPEARPEPKKRVRKA